MDVLLSQILFCNFIYLWLDAEKTIEEELTDEDYQAFFDWLEKGKFTSVCINISWEMIA